MKKWILTILMIVTVMILVSIAMVNMISGTSPVHKEALEKAFSDALQGKVKFEKLVNFNVAPQFIIDAEGIIAEELKGGGTAHVKKFEIAFGFEDLAFSRHHIEKFNIIDLEATNVVDGINKITLDKVTIDNPDRGDIAYLVSEGTLDDLPVKGRVNLKVFPGGRRSYALDDVNKTHLEFGKLLADGELKPFADGGATMTSVIFHFGDEACPVTTRQAFMLKDLLSEMFDAAKGVTSSLSFQKFCAAQTGT